MMMQAPGPSRSMQRRYPGAEPGGPSNLPARSMSPAVGVGTNAASIAPRSSTASSGSGRWGGGGGSRKQHVSGRLRAGVRVLRPGIIRTLAQTFPFFPSHSILLCIHAIPDPTSNLMRRVACGTSSNSCRAHATLFYV